MLSAFANSLKIPELRQRIFFTLGLVFICRVIACVPLPGVDVEVLRQLIQKIESSSAGGFLGFIDVFSGGAIQNCAIGALGIMPYISASIILQLMTAIIPHLERLVREGESGRQKLSQYTRYLTLAICAIQGFVFAVALESPGMWNGLRVVPESVAGWGFRLSSVLVMTTGTMLLMWLGEQITERGIGNGISLVITVSIVSRLAPAVFMAKNMFVRGPDSQAQFNIFYLVMMIAMILAVTAGTIALTQGIRKIPIHTTKRVIGRKVYGGQNTYMPLRVNYSGVMPIIFASVILQFPAVVFRRIPWLQAFGDELSMNRPLHWVIYSALILFFSYFWVATQFNPLQIADDLKKNGGYVPGIRPGRPTAEFLDKAMTRITLVGAIALTVIAIIPSIMYNYFQIPWLVSSFFGGTSQLIVVGVALDTMRQVESYLLMRHYDGFLTKGHLRGRR